MGDFDEIIDKPDCHILRQRSFFERLVAKGILFRAAERIAVSKKSRVTHLRTVFTLNGM